MTRSLLTNSALLLALAADGADAQFASRVVDYHPAPGQFVQNPAFNNPARALGPPVGGGTTDGDETKCVTLGGFAGTLTLAFDSPVLNDPKNPLGLDCIVFGNAFWPGADSGRRWAEPATIEISLDANANTLADDAWFLIPGSHIAIPAAHWQGQTWDDDPIDTTFPPSSLSWIPPGESGLWTTWGFRLPSDPFESGLVLDNPNGPGELDEGVWGYAELSPTLLLGDLDADNDIDDPMLPPARFYTVPDDPFRVGIDPGSGGGDAFDIAWAIDVATGAPARLPAFHFIRITNAANVVFPVFGERSPEIAGVADVAPALDAPGVNTPASVRGRFRP